jgi:hypothetical protein
MVGAPPPGVIPPQVAAMGMMVCGLQVRKKCEYCNI